MRFKIPDFELANKIYAGASVTFYTVDANGNKTSTKATIYDGYTGSTTLGNPQTLDSEGKFNNAVYAEEAVICSVTGLTIADHDTGIIGPPWNFKEAWTTATIYSVNDVVSITTAEDAAKNGVLYVCTARHTSGTFATDRDTNSYWTEFVDVALVKNWATKTTGVVSDSEYSAKAYAIGGTGVTDTAGKGSAKEWATNPENDLVDTVEYSAKHYSIKAAGSATTALAAAQGWASVITVTSGTTNIETADARNYYIIDASAGTVTINMPAIGTSDGILFGFEVSNVDNAITIVRDGTDTINGAASDYTGLVSVGQVIHFIGDDASPDNWLATIISQVNTATTTSEGIMEIATQAEVDAGTDTVRAVTSATLEGKPRPYDVAFIAGFDSTMALEDLVVQTYGELIVPRALTLTGEQLYMDTAPTGAAAIFDVLVNGTTVYSTLPQVADGANAGTAGVLSTTALAAGDRLTFKCTQIGSTTAGQGARFTLAGALA